ncbi:MAG: Do family serine endopeptidase, partial [Fibrobacteres bacterium]|nr:Do family serine endopeptidase [Fibrobacterota bacterium]
MVKRVITSAVCLLTAFAIAADKPAPGSIKFGSDSRIQSDISKAKQTSQAFINVAKAVSPCVVSVSSAKILKAPAQQFYGSPFDFFFGPGMPPQQGQPQQKEREYRQEGLGSGVIVSADGYILTNNHVVEGADEITITIEDGKDVEAEIVGTDRESDIAVLKLKEKVSKLTVAAIGNSDALEIGEWVLAIGNPFSKKLSHTVTAGIVSAKGRSTGINIYENFIQTDASINPGNSGGALVNLAGEVIGINTAIMSTSGGNVGIGFAIPMNMAKKIMEDLVYKGKVSRGWLGIEMQDVDKNLSEALGMKDNNGVLVKSVLEKTPAEKGGMKSGDVIIAINDEKVTSPEQLKNMIGNLLPETKLSIKVLRDKKEKKLDVVLAERAPGGTGAVETSTETEDDLIGLSVSEIT